MVKKFVFRPENALAVVGVGEGACGLVVMHLRRLVNVFLHYIKNIMYLCMFKTIGYAV